MFSTQIIGNTIAQDIIIKSRLVGVLAYDILPFSNSINKDTIMQSLLDKVYLQDRVQYLVIDQKLLLQK